MKIHAPALALGLSLLCNAINLPTMADETAATATSTTTATVPSAAAVEKDNGPELKVELKMDPKADAILHKVSTFYAGLKGFDTTLQREGKNGETSHKASYKIIVEKPNKLSIQISGGAERFAGGLAKMDGEKLFLYNPVFGYVSSPATTSYDDLIRDHEFQFATAYVLHGQSLLEALITENPYDFLQNHYGLKGGTIVGQEKVDGVDTDHLRLESHRLAYDIWVESGDKPWVKRVQTEVTKHKSETTRKLTFDYEKSSVDARPASSDFKFNAPAEAKEIPSFFGTDKTPKKEAQSGHADSSTKEGAANPGGPDANPLLNKPAPELNLETLGGGKMNLSSFKDKNVVVLDFWATWCGPCRKALPILSDVTRAYAEKGVKFFAIDLKEEPAKVKEFLKTNGLDINVALDKDGQAAGKYGVEGIPQSVIIGKNGVIRVIHVGYNEGLRTRLPAELDQVLADKEVTE